MGRHTSGENLEGQRFGRLLVLELLPEPTRRKHYRCICDCGAEKIVEGANLKRGATKSCGCIVVEINKTRQHTAKLTNDEAVFNVLYSRYKTQALKRDYGFQLTKDQLKSLSKEDCFYCGEQPSQELHHKGTVLMYNGIDRIDNSKGYSKNNCVPCCGVCNTMKMSMSLHDFLAKIKRISERHTAK